MLRNCQHPQTCGPKNWGVLAKDLWWIPGMRGTVRSHGPCWICCCSIARNWENVPRTWRSVLLESKTKVHAWWWLQKAIFLLFKNCNTCSQLVNCSQLVRFSLRHGDQDISVMLETTVPPTDLASISIFANALGKFNSQVRLPKNTWKSHPPKMPDRWTNQRMPKLPSPSAEVDFCCGISVSSKTLDVRLSAQLLSTTWQQTQLQLEGDVQKLREWSARFEVFAGQQVG